VRAHGPRQIAPQVMHTLAGREIGKRSKMTKATDVCPDFPEWPESWKGFNKDVPYGQSIIEIFEPFIQHLIDKGITKKTIRQHCNNLWLLGGEIIREVSNNNQHRTNPYNKVIHSIDAGGGPLCRHLETENQIELI